MRKIEATEPISDFDKLIERTKKLEKKILPKKKEKRANKK